MNRNALIRLLRAAIAGSQSLFPADRPVIGPKSPTFGLKRTSGASGALRLLPCPQRRSETHANRWLGLAPARSSRDCRPLSLLAARYPRSSRSGLLAACWSSLVAPPRRCRVVVACLGPHARARGRATLRPPVVVAFASGARRSETWLGSALLPLVAHWSLVARGRSLAACGLSHPPLSRRRSWACSRPALGLLIDALPVASRLPSLLVGCLLAAFVWLCRVLALHRARRERSLRERQSARKQVRAFLLSRRSSGIAAGFGVALIQRVLRFESGVGPRFCPSAFLLASPERQ